jgi:hypothetical protein
MLIEITILTNVANLWPLRKHFVEKKNQNA